MSESTGYGPDYYKSESELRKELAAKDARIAALETVLRRSYGRLAGTEVYPSRLVREEIVEVLKGSQI